MAMKRVATTNSGVDSHYDVTKKEDLTGRERLISNVLWGWGSYLMIMMVGFIMPRLIDRRIGQINLGIWDFSWSLVSYLSYSSMGIGSSVNRYVAKYRAIEDLRRLRGAVSSVFLVQIGISLFILAGSAIIAFFLPTLFSEKLATRVEAAQWVVIFLGASLAVDQASATFRGVITGCHRWDIHNILNVSTRVGAFLAMLSVLLLGMGLEALAVSYFAAILTFSILKVLIAYRVCPELKISTTYANLAQAKQMVTFGWKSFVINLSSLVILQTINVFITRELGPARLAVFARSIALVRYMETIVKRFAFVISPIVGVLQTREDSKELKNFFCESCKLGVSLTLPMVLVFVFFGNIIMQLWMGSNYAFGLLLPVLVAGYFFPVALRPAINILIGLNKHGKIGFAAFCIMLVIFGIELWMLKKIGWSLLKCAVALCIPLILGNGLIVPLFASKLFEIKLKEFAVEIFFYPILCNLPLLGIFWTCRTALNENPVISMLLGLGIGLPVTGVLYFYHVLPSSYRDRLISAFSSKRGHHISHP